MFSIFEKIRFVIATKLGLRAERKAYSKNKKNDSRLVRTLKGTIKTVAIIFVLLFTFGLYLYYTEPPTIIVTNSYDKKICTNEHQYMIKGSLNSGNKSQLKINNKVVELIDNDFTFDANIKTGDNRFIFEASNKRGVTREIHIVHLPTETEPRCDTVFK